MMAEPLSRQLEIVRLNFNDDLQAAAGDGIRASELIALARAIAEDLVMVLPCDLRQPAAQYVVDGFAETIDERTRAGE